MSYLGTPCSIGRTITSKFGGSSSTINEAYVAANASSLGTTSPMLTTRPDFSSETDIRKARPSSTNPSSTNIGRNNIQHSNSSSALRPSDSYHQVTYVPQSSLPPTTNPPPPPPPPRSQSVHPIPSCISDSLSTLSLANRPPSTNIYASTTSLSSTTSGGTTTTTQIPNKGTGTTHVPLTRKSITEYANRTFRVIFSDDSAMIIREDSPDGQIFIDAQGKRYSFDRRQPHQPEAIQERLALFYQNDPDSVEYATSIITRLVLSETYFCALFFLLLFAKKQVCYYFLFHSICLSLLFLIIRIRLLFLFSLFLRTHTLLKNKILKYRNIIIRMCLYSFS